MKWPKFLRARTSPSTKRNTDAQDKHDDYQSSMAEATRHLQAGDLDMAADGYRKAIGHDPTQAAAYISLGYVQNETGALESAVEAFHSALRHDSSNAEAHYLVGSVFLVQGKLECATEHFKQAIVFNPLFSQAYTDAALVLFKLGRSNEALILLSSGMELMPKELSLIFAKGNLLAEASRFREAVDVYNEVLALSPDFPECLANIGNCERHLGFIELALQHLEAAIAFQPGNAAWWSNRLFTLQYGGKLDQAALFREHQNFAAKFESPLRATLPAPGQSAPANSPLRVGYVSGDLRQHSLAYFIEPILRHHDRRRVEIFCYYTYPASDAVTDRLKDLSDRWRDCASLSDESMARQIAEDGIDVLIDLSGHTGHNRLLVFARKPSPVQMTWLGYQATTGLESIDYRITDAGIDPVGQAENFHTEKLLRLSSGAIFQPDPQSPDVAGLPSLHSGIFTFGCLNNPAKITADFVAATAKILTSTSNTRLLLGNANTKTSALLIERYESHGVDQSRLVLVEPLPFLEYLQLHSQIDLAFDTFPYNGGTTTMHSLWMGVPVLTMEGHAAVGRVGTQMMRGLGFDTFVCRTLEEYINRAVELSDNQALMQDVRADLRPKMNVLMVAQAKTFTAELEDVFFSARARASF